MKKKLLLTLAMALMLCALLAVGVSAAQEGVLTYSVSGGKTTVTDCDTSASGTLVIPDSLGDAPVTSIGFQAFYNCRSLQSITIPDSVTSIGAYAFYNCTDLTGITIPAGVTSIGVQAFYNTPNLTVYGYTGSFAEAYANENNIPFAALGNGADVEIDSGTCGENLTWILTGDRVLTISGIGAIADWSFNYDYVIKTVVIESGVASIGSRAFNGCTSLTSITIPNSVTSIDYLAFSECTSLTSIAVDVDNAAYCDVDGVLFTKDMTTLHTYPAGKTTTSYVIPSGVTYIMTGAFNFCKSLTSITIPSSVTSIGYSVFENCTSLTGIAVDVGNTAYCDADGVLFTKDMTTLYTYPAGKTATSYTIPSSVTSIRNQAFYYCTSLQSITIPNSVTSIGQYAFYYCYNVTSITIPASVTYIAVQAFNSCTKLQSITIPDSVTYIGHQAFYNCPNLTIYGYSDSTAETYANENSIPFVAIYASTITGTAAAWDNTDNALYYLYPATVADADIRKEWTAGTYPTSGNILAAGTGGTITAAKVDGKAMYTQSFSFAGVTDGTYKLVIFKSGTYVAKITQITVSGANIDTGMQKLWLYGDVNYDGEVNNNDVLQINRRIAKLSSIFNSGDAVTKTERLVAANVSAITGTDTEVNNTDVLQINRKIAKFSSVFKKLP